MTTFLRGQNVDPETFPALNSGIGSKYLYTNTGGEGKILVDDIIVGSIDTVAVTYSEFYSLITSNQLIGGNTYILMDFQTVYDQMDFDNSGNLKPTLVTKTGAIEQIWVLALSSNQIADKAYSATYPKDEIQYDWTYNTTLVNGAPAKGRISERIDEWNNRTDYDHREIKFIRYDNGSGVYNVINDNGNASAEFLTFGNNYGAGGIIHDNWLGDFYSIGQFLGQEYSNNVFQGNTIITNKTSTMFYNNTFMLEVVSNSFGGNLSSNSFGGDLQSNSFGGELSSNSFGGNLYRNSFDGYLSLNSFSGNLYSNSFGGNLQSNSFGRNLHSNSFRGDLSLNSFGGHLSSNSFGGSLYSNSFDGDLQSNSFGGNLSSNSFIFNTFFYYTILNGQINGKTIDDVIYPFLFGTDYEKRIFKASDGNVYARYFDGTNDVNTLIP